MGLFGNVFEKKQCSICGKDIGLLGNRKLSDGNMCKDCASLLSPFFSDRRASTVEEIKQQLAYREENKTQLQYLNPTVVLGTKMKIYLDEAQKKFIVTRTTDWRSHNPDIIDLSQLDDVEIEVEEHKDEIYTKDAEGKRISYNPKKYEIEYEFTINLVINSPYFSNISFELTEGDRPKAKLIKAYKDYEKMAEEIRHTLLPEKYPLPEEGKKPEVTTTAPVTDKETWTCPSCGKSNTGKFCVGCGTAKPVDESWKCPSCGTLNTGKFCSGCGKPKVVKWFCPECGHENEGAFCSACGTKKPEETVVAKKTNLSM